MKQITVIRVINYDFSEPMKKATKTKSNYKPNTERDYFRQLFENRSIPILTKLVIYSL